MSDQPCPPLPRANILGVGVSAINLQRAADQILCWVRQAARTYVVVAPVYTIMMCYEQPALRLIANRAGMVTPDGMPVALLCRWLGFKEAGRVYGPDLMLLLSDQGRAQGLRHYYYGGAEGVADQLAASMRQRFPGIDICGTDCPPFRELSPAEQEAALDRINQARPDILWLGLGSPKQDRWMADHRAHLNAPVLIGVGAAFDFHTGRVRQAPRWMQRLALEWLFRLLVEPARLWRRYLIYNPRFIWAVTLQRLGLRRYTLEDPPPENAV